jgi:hypothetical protein
VRTSFELEFEASDFYESQAIALNQAADFLKLDVTEVSEKLSIEFKVKNSDTEDKFKVTAHIQVKTGISLNSI